MLYLGLFRIDIVYYSTYKLEDPIYLQDNNQMDDRSIQGFCLESQTIVYQQMHDGIIIRDHEGQLELIAWRGFYFTAETQRRLRSLHDGRVFVWTNGGISLVCP